MLAKEQVLQLSLDDGVRRDSLKIGMLKNWKSLGKNDVAIWGECQGSSLYQVRALSTGQGYKCSCPSHKQPCKHVLGLLLVYAQNVAEVPNQAVPDWVQGWLENREKIAKQRQSTVAAKDAPTPEQLANKQKRREERHKKIITGLEELDIWLSDFIRNGLTNPQIHLKTYWNDRSARLVDAQAPGLANRLQQLRDVVFNKASDKVIWELELLNGLGCIALLSHAYQNLEKLPPDMQDDIYQCIGWTYQDEEIQARGQKIHDTWIVIGQKDIPPIDNICAQRTWFIGSNTKKIAMYLQFSPKSSIGFKEIFHVGTCRSGEMVYWPSHYPLRAKLTTSVTISPTYPMQIPGYARIEDFLTSYANLIANVPWHESWPCVLHHVCLVFSKNNDWYIQDAGGNILPLEGKFWHLLAVANSSTFSITGEWNGKYITPFLFSCDEKKWIVIDRNINNRISASYDIPF